MCPRTKTVIPIPYPHWRRDMKRPSKVANDGRSLSFNSESFEQAQYEAVANQAQLEQLALVKQRYDADAVRFWSDDEAGTFFKKSFAGSPKGRKFNREDGFVIGGFSWSARIKQSRKNALRLTAEYMLVFRGLDSCTSEDEYVYLYFDKISRFATYPYFRNLFAMCAANSGITLPPLPSLNERVD